MSGWGWLQRNLETGTPFLRPGGGGGASIREGLNTWLTNCVTCYSALCFVFNMPYTCITLNVLTHMQTVLFLTSKPSHPLNLDMHFCICILSTFFLNYLPIVYVFCKWKSLFHFVKTYHFRLNCMFFNFKWNRIIQRKQLTKIYFILFLLKDCHMDIHCFA